MIPRFYKLYIGDYVVYLVDSFEDVNIAKLPVFKALTVKYKSPKQLAKLLEEMPKYNTKTFILYHHDVKEMRRALFNNFLIIEAAGGLVLNENGDILFIFRHGKWDLPKGKVEVNEQLEQAAVREVQEETGVKVDAIQSKLIRTFHTYSQNRANVLKVSYWYLMHASGEHKIKPQIEEGIRKVEWVKREDLDVIFANCYPSIRDVVKDYLRRIDEYV